MIKKVPPRFELGSPDSKSGVITNYTMEPKCHQQESNLRRSGHNAEYCHYTMMAEFVNIEAVTEVD